MRQVAKPSINYVEKIVEAGPRQPAPRRSGDGFAAGFRKLALEESGPSPWDI